MFSLFLPPTFIKHCLLNKVLRRWHGEFFHACLIVVISVVLSWDLFQRVPWARLTLLTLGASLEKPGQNAGSGDKYEVSPTPRITVIILLEEMKVFFCFGLLLSLKCLSLLLKLHDSCKWLVVLD